MNFERAGIVLRERALLEVMDLSLRFVFGLAAPAFTRLALLLLAPALAATVVAYWFLEWSAILVWMLAVCLGGVAQGAFTLAAGRQMFADEVSAKEVLRELGQRLFSYVWALLISRILIALAGLVIVALPFAWMRMLYVHEAVLLEKASGTEALRRSNRFVAHHAKDALGTWFSFLAATALAIGAAEITGRALVSFVLQSGEPFSLFRDGVSPYALAGYFASIPFIAAARFLTYIDTRARRDGWDIQIRFIAIEAASAERVT